MATTASTSSQEVYDYSLSKVIFASSAGTMIEWYDFYIFGSLATTLAPIFFAIDNPVIGFLSTLATFATGFLVRPFGAAIFGRIGDMVGRKFTFILTISIMGGSTFLIGLLPTYEQIGLAAPLLLVLLRLAQGAALGGEYGGAAIYVAEHAPDNRRGFFTSFIQTTATLGLLVSLAIVVGVRVLTGEEAFNAWGWRIPFLLSAILVAIALYIRLSLRETPLFTKLKDEKKTSSSPIKDSFRNNAWRLMLVALMGATAGQAVVWYTGQFYALFFMQNELDIGLVPSSVMVGIAIVFATPFFLLFGHLSDRIGRKPIILGGCLVAAITYVPIYQAMIAASDPLNYVAMTALVFIQIVYVTAVYGPIAAFLVELFPTKVRYTSLSLPYHIGNGWFGGLTPLIAASLAAATGNPLAGLIYPIGIAVLTFVIGFFLIKETKDVKIWDDVDVALHTRGAGEIVLDEERERSGTTLR